MNEKPVLEIPLNKPWSERLKFFDEHPEMMIPEQLGNLHMYLPGAMHREFLTESQLDTVPSESGYYSEKRMRQTQGQFLDELDKAIADSNIDVGKLTELGHTRKEAILEERDDDSVLLRRQIEEISLPVYALLRERGYNTYDITR